MAEPARRLTLAEHIEARAGVTIVKPRRAHAAQLLRTQRDTDAGTLRGFVYPRYYEPNTPQRTKFHLEDDANVARIRYLVACCGRRGGKTQAGAAQFVDNILRDLDDKLLGRGYWQGDPHESWVRPEGKDPEAFLRYFVVAPTSALLDEPAIALQRMLGHARNKREPGLIIKQGRDELGILCWWLRKGIRIDFLSGERPDLLVGRGYRGGWFEEAARLKPNVWRDNLRPALSDFDGWAIFTTTPLGRNWFWQDIWAKGNAAAAEMVAKLKACPIAEVLNEQFRCVSWTTADNDAVPNLKEEMEIARRQMSDANWRRNYKGDFDAFEGQCFDLKADMFARWTRGLVKRIYAGFDSGNVGETSHRSAFSIVIQKPDGGDWHEVRTESGHDLLPFGDDAWKARDRGDRSTWANRLYVALRDVVGDLWRTVPVAVPADRPDIAREWKRYGFRTTEAYQEHEPALTWVQTAIRSGRLKIASEVLWSCMTALRFPEPGKSSRKLWVDESDDEWDALRYALSEIIEAGEAPSTVSLSAMGWRRR